MKRFWLVMLSLGLVLAFSAQALAVDVKFSGEFMVGGMYLDKTTVKKDTSSDGPSTAFYFQRLRVNTDFVVSPGLKLVTRLDAMERVWGGARSTATAAVPSDQSAQSAYETENIAFDHVYLQYDSPIGTFKVGYMDDLVWGTVFCDSATPRGVIGWNKIVGPWNFIVKVIKANDNSKTAITPGANADLDNDKYAAAVKYTWNTGEAGLLGAMYRDARKRNTGTPNDDYNAKYYALLPYAKAQVGPVKVQAEVVYAWGKWMEYESGSTQTDISMQNLGIFIDAVADFNMFYAGGTLAYMSGDDPGTLDKYEGTAVVTGGYDWNPCLIMFNQERSYWAGAIAGYDTASNSSYMSNAWFAQGKVGVRPFANLDIMASLSFATADKKPTPTWVGNAYGYELDVTGTYKITNNLSYMLGVGYLFTGEFYKGTNAANSLRDDYMLINKLTLTF